MISNLELVSVNVTHAIGVFFAFAFVYLLLGNHNDILPRDQGRELSTSLKNR